MIFPKVSLLIGLLALIAVILLAVFEADAACPEDSVDPGQTSSPTNPVQLVVQDACITWAVPPPGFEVHHYHYYAGGIMLVSQTGRSYLHSITEKRVVEEIRIKSVSPDIDTTETTVSDPLYIEWVDRQCLTGNIVVTCP